MGWELRDGRRYYYSAKKLAGRVVKIYRGRGRMGEMAEALETEARRRDERREAFRIEKARTSLADRTMQDLDRACERAVQAALVSAGFHKVSGAWRRRRVRSVKTALARAATRK